MLPFTTSPIYTAPSRASRGEAEGVEIGKHNSILWQRSYNVRPVVSKFPRNSGPGPGTWSRSDHVRGMAIGQFCTLTAAVHAVFCHSVMAIIGGALEAYFQIGSRKNHCLGRLAASCNLLGRRRDGAANRGISRWPQDLPAATVARSVEKGRRTVPVLPSEKPPYLLRT